MIKIYADIFLITIAIKMSKQNLYPTWFFLFSVLYPSIALQTYKYMVRVAQHPPWKTAKQFTNKTGIAVHVNSGPTAQWSEKAKLDADIIYSGSEAMMSDFENAFLSKL